MLMENVTKIFADLFTAKLCFMGFPREYQQILACSKSTKETLEKGMKYVQSNNKDTRATSLLLPLNECHNFCLMYEL